MSEKQSQVNAPVRNFDELLAAKKSEVTQPEDYGDPVVEGGQYQVGGPIEKPDMGREVLMPAVARAGRMTADAVAAMPLTAMDAGVSLRNFASEIANLNRPGLSTGYSQTYPPYSAYYKDAMDKSPLPPAGNATTEVYGYQVPTEQIADAVGQIVVGSKVMPNIGIKNPAPSQTKLPTLAEKAIKAGEQHRVPVYYDDVGGNVSKRVGVAAERIPVVGTGGGRAAQQKAVNKATQKLADKHYIDDDIPDLVQKGLQDKLNGFRKAATKLYDDVGTLVGGRGDVKTDSFDDAILKEMARQEKLGTAANPDVVKALEKYASAPRGNFAFMRELRSQLGDDISTFYSPGSAVGNKGAGSMQVIKNALESDMGKFADDAGPTAKAAWRKANEFYAKNVIPFKQAGLRQLVKTDEPAKAWRYLVQQSAGKARAEKMYRSLDTGGRRAVRSGLIQDAIEHSKTAKGDISPAKFAQYMEKHSNAVDQFFAGKDLSEIKGFQNLMRHVERAGQYAENPPTGQRVIDVAVGGGAVAATLNPAVLKFMALLAASGESVKLLFQTEGGRNLLIAASKVKPGSPAMGEVAKHMAAAVATQSKP